MNDIIVVTFTLTRDELIESVKQCYSVSWLRYIFPLLFVLLPIALILFFIMLYLNPQFNDMTALIVLCFLIACTYTYYISPYRIKRYVLRYSGAFIDHEMTWEVSNEGLNYNCEGIENGNFKWILVSQAIRTPKGFLIFTSPTVFHWFPIHAFKSDVDIGKFNEIVEENVKRYKDKT